MILEKIEKLLEEVKNLNASTPEEIEALRLKYLSKKVKSMPLWLISGMSRQSRRKKLE